MILYPRLIKAPALDLYKYETQAVTTRSKMNWGWHVLICKLGSHLEYLGRYHGTRLNISSTRALSESRRIFASSSDSLNLIIDKFYNCKYQLTSCWYGNIAEPLTTGGFSDSYSQLQEVVLVWLTFLIIIIHLQRSHTDNKFQLLTPQDGEEAIVNESRQTTVLSKQNWYVDLLS